MRTSRLSLSAALLVSATALTACDEVVLYDVSPSGRLLVAADANGRCALSGGTKPRHLFSVDPTTGALKRLTKTPRRLSWPTACGDGALFIDAKTRLMHLSASGALKVVHTVTRGRLLQPLTAPSLGHVAVLEAKKLGVPGTLVVLDLTTSRVVHRVERALVGAVWTRAGLILACAEDAQRKAYASGPGEIVRIDRRFRTKTVFRGTLPAVSVLTAAGPKAVITALHTSGDDGPLALARLDTRRRGAQRGARGSFDFWPAADAGGKRVLFTRASAARRSIQGELRLAKAAAPDVSRVIPTQGQAVAAPRWVGPNRVSYLTTSDHLVIQDVDGKNRIDLTSSLRSSFGAATN